MQLDSEPFFRNAPNPVEALAPGGAAINMGLKHMINELHKDGYDVEASSFSSHSLRRGGAQFLRDRGVPRDVIKVLGRWKSDAVDAYFKTLADGRVRGVAARLFSTLVSPWETAGRRRCRKVACEG